MTLKQRLRRSANRLVLARLGLELRRVPVGREDEMGASLRLLRALGIAPRTVVDVGLNRDGTPPLYRAFPEARFLLVEPVEEFQADIRRWLSSLGSAVLVKAALGATTGRQPLWVSEGLGNATLAEPGSGAPPGGDRWKSEGVREVAVLRLDDLVAEQRLPGPFVVKVDVDGRDLDVLRGGERTLADTDCVVLEAGVWQLAERVAFLEERGFRLWDIVDLAYKRGVLYQVDLVFLGRRHAGSARFRPWADPLVLGEPLHGHR